MTHRIPTYVEPSFAAGPDDPALAAIRASVAARLATVCAALPAEERAALVDSIARFQRRWEIREATERDALRKARVVPARPLRSAPGPVSGASSSAERRPD
ncbi:MAG TPA: hypothetical protein VF761_10540 [Gemmatimonadaceae bacterium]